MKIMCILSILLSLYVLLLTLTMSFFYYFNRSINEKYSTNQDVLIGVGVIWILISMAWLIYHCGKKLAS